MQYWINHNATVKTETVQPVSKIRPAEKLLYHLRHLHLYDTRSRDRRLTPVENK